MLKFEVRYTMGHSYTEPWEHTRYYCLNCGKQEVWVRSDGGDYYAGETHLCIACESEFHLPDEPRPVCGDPSKDGRLQTDQRLTAIRAALRR